VNRELRRIDPDVVSLQDHSRVMFVGTSKLAVLGNRDCSCKPQPFLNTARFSAYLKQRRRSLHVANFDVAMLIQAASVGEITRDATCIQCATSGTSCRSAASGST
jgi:hypothetical protein